MSPTHPTWTASTQQRAPSLDVRALRHPTEASRFALALVSTAAGTALVLYLLLALLTSSQVLWQVAVLLGVVALTWIAVQLWRVRMLADAVKVDDETLPELSRIVADVRHRLAFDRRVDVFVVDKLGRVLPGETRTTTVTTFFGIRVIVLEGSLIGDLTREEDRRRCTFLVATLIGALKARHAQWGAVLEVLHTLKLTLVVAPLVTPWLRATVYTGDRLAYACCDDLDVSLRAAYRSLVGGDVASELRATGLVQQALAVRRSRILRVAQLLRGTPHVPNRYLELLAFAGSRQPADYARFRQGLEAHTADLDRLVARHQRRGSQEALVPLAFVAAGGLVLAAVVAAATTGDGGSVGPSAPPPSSTVVAPSVDVPTTTPPAVVEVSDALLAQVPEAVQGSCSATDPTQAAALAVVSLTCPTQEGVQLGYVGFDSAFAVQQAFETSTAQLTTVGDCLQGIEGTSSWSTSAGLYAGQLACVDGSGGAVVVWTDEENLVVGSAAAPGWSVAELTGWWQDVVAR
ncbi:hypothetical protein [Mumia sp. DW29H23]|uniref:hypothetical protein n=1 Tax=Mumia sp. DW29H23 TaxID=3421241 RepID=UPI003D681726